MRVIKHIHSARENLRVNQWVYQTCRCGAKRTCRLKTAGGYSSIRPDFPQPKQGWVKDFVPRQMGEPPRGPAPGARTSRYNFND